MTTLSKVIYSVGDKMTSFLPALPSVKYQGIYASVECIGHKLILNKLIWASAEHSP